MGSAGASVDGGASQRGTILLSIFDWWYHSHGHSDMQIAQALAERGPVLFVNSIGMRLPGHGGAGSPLRRIARKIGSGVRAAARPLPGLDLTVATPIFWPAYAGTAGRINQSALRFQIARLASRLRFHRPLVIVTLPTYADAALGLDRSALIYNRSDRHSDFAYCDRALVAEKESALFREADVVLYASRALHAAESGWARGASIHIGHGVDLKHFSPAGPIAAELAHIPRPRVGFFGDLRGHAIDFPLLEVVAQQRPDVQFVLGGSQLEELTGLQSLPNVHLLNVCSYTEMPARWRGLDVAILPYRLTAWQEASEPIKLNEIAAMRLPAVGTRLPAFARRDVVIADTAAAFAEAIDEVLAAPDPPRVSTAGLRDWTVVADEVAAFSNFAPSSQWAA